MTEKFDKLFKKLLHEDGVYGSVGGTSVGPNKVNSSQGTQQNTSTNKTGTNARQRTFGRITNKKMDPSQNEFYSKFDFSKGEQENQLDDKKVNSYDYVTNIANRIQTGQAVNPVHLQNLAGIMEANPELAREFKQKGINYDALSKSYLKQGVIGSNTQIDRNLETRFKNLLR